MKKPKIKINDLESFWLDEVLSQVKQRKKIMKDEKQKALNIKANNSKGGNKNG